MAAGEKAVGALLLWAWLFHPTFRTESFLWPCFLYPRSGESRGSEEKSKGDHSDQLLGSQGKVGDGLPQDEAAFKGRLDSSWCQSGWDLHSRLPWEGSTEQGGAIMCLLQFAIIWEGDA